MPTFIGEVFTNDLLNFTEDMVAEQSEMIGMKPIP